ncbi:MAG: hypothetical protein M1821_005833 [Bathelium mastoideum]|nr:MAG: hypothetical protein M1821_005833 [Bathelium mastoideum]
MAPILSGYFDGLFWNRLLLQLGQNEPAIKHAMMAVSSMYERFESSAANDPLFPVQEDRFALTSYNKAIKSLSQRLSDDGQSVHVPLVACILFICLEFLRRDIDAAMTHMHSGFAILRARTIRSSQTGFPRTRDEINAEETMLSTFVRLRILSGLFGRPAPPMKVYEGPIDEWSNEQLDITNFAEARSTLYKRMAPCLVFVRVCGEARYDAVISPDYLMKQASFTTSLAQWKSAFEDWFSTRPVKSNEDHLAANLLRLHYGIAEVWLAMCLRPNETDFDEYTDKFKEMVNYASSLINAPQAIPAETGSHFSFEMGTVPPLYFIAVKCRHPVIRRRAIGFLLTSPRREGLWDAYRAGRVAERVMIREELGFSRGTGYLSAQVMCGHYTSELPTLTARGESVTASETVPLFARSTDFQAQSATKADSKLAEGYEHLRRESAGGAEASGHTSQEQIFTPGQSGSSEVNALGMTNTAMHARWREMSEENYPPSSLDPRMQSISDQAINPLGIENFHPSLTDVSSYNLPIRALPTTDPGHAEWPQEQFRFHLNPYSQREYMKSPQVDKPNLWLNEDPSLHVSYPPTATQDFVSPTATSGSTSNSSPFAEAADGSEGFPPSSQSRMPAEEDRIHDIMPTEMPGELQRIHDTRIANEVAAPFKRTTQPVTFRSKPHGVHGEWQVWGETIRL